MNFICPDCGSQYLVDESKVGTDGVALQCSQCGASFRVRRRPTTRVGAVSPTQPPPAPPLPPPPPALARTATNGPRSASGAQLSPPATPRGWRLRTQSGVVQLDGLETLQRWVSEGRITRDAEISRNGESWRRLGELSDLQPIFLVAEAARTRRPSGAAASGPERDSLLRAEPSGPRALGAMPALRDEPAFAQQSASRTLPPTVGGGAAWERQGARASAFEDDARPPPRRVPRRGKLLRVAGLLAAALLLLTVGLTVALQSDRLRDAWQRVFSGADRVADARAALRRRLGQDDESSLSALDRELAADPRPAARVLRAEALTIWAQHLRDQAELLERRARQLITALRRELAASAEAAPGQAPGRGDEAATRREARALRLQAANLRDGAARQLATAEGQLRVAAGATPAPVDLPRAQADLNRMLGRTDVAALIQQARSALPDDPELAYVEGLYWQEHSDIARAVGLLETTVARSRAAGGPLLLRAAMALSMIHLRSGWYADAKRYAELVRALNPQHAWAEALLQQIAAELSQPRREEASASPAPSAPPQALPTAPSAELSATSTAGAEAAPADPNSPAAGDTTAAGSASSAGTGASSAAPADVGAARSAGGSYEALLRQADQASEHGRTMQALSTYERALRIRPDGVEAITGLGYCALDLQQLGLAIQRFTQALSMRPSHGDALVGLAEAYQAMGDKTRALDSYRAYLRLNPNGAKALMAQQNAKELSDALAPTAAPAPGAGGPAPADGTESPASRAAPEAAPETAPEAAPTSPTEPSGPPPQS
ncbi:MAG: zinc-ribbon domain-containing protein [Proteobacteria bacterium]|nr:zinc-ribbon domain-containing protein [Pseudomonadota bacterium]